MHLLKGNMALNNLPNLWSAQARDEKQLIKLALEANSGLWAPTAAALQVPMSTLQGLISRHGLCELRQSLRETANGNSQQARSRLRDSVKPTPGSIKNKRKS
jgi:hypothetical protein